MLEIGIIYLGLCSPHLMVAGWLLGQGTVAMVQSFITICDRGLSGVETLVMTIRQTKIQGELQYDKERNKIREDHNECINRF